jgi:hypothetical protein
MSAKIAVIETQEEEIADLKKTIDTLETKVHNLELKVEAVALKEAGGMIANGQLLCDFVFRLTFVIFAGWLLWRFGLQAPPTP